MWLEGGSYAAYLKIEQNIDAWQALDPSVHEAIIGRREADGSRLDLPAGTDPKVEGEFTDLATPPVNAHVRKSGPRGPVHDLNLIFRRGVPYAEVSGGALHVGLQFVSYQASLDDFDVVLNRWMLNSEFPNPGSGQDALIANGLISFLRAGFFVVPPHEDRFPAAGYFDPPPAEGNHRAARVHIRKSVVDQAGNPTSAEIGGVQFQLIDATSGALIGDPATTNPAGRALLTGAHVGQNLLVRETPGDRFEPVPDQPVTAEQRNTIVRIANRLRAGASPYGG